jgi:uncharacterized DUF497 family protein
VDARIRIAGNDFIWDIEKAESNRFSHGIRFDRLARLLYVVHVEFDGDCIRLISARLATTTEESEYVD